MITAENRNAVTRNAEKVFLNGQAFYAGLSWLSVPFDTNRRLWCEREGRRLKAGYVADYGPQTGFLANVLANGRGSPADRPTDRPDGIPAAAAFCAETIGSKQGGEQGAWLALVATDGPQTLIVQAKDGRILPQGDNVFLTTGDALAAFSTIREQGWEHIFASPAFAIEGAQAFEPHPAADFRAARLKPLVLRGHRPALLASALLGLAVIPWLASMTWDEVMQPPRVVEQMPLEQPVVKQVHQDAGRFLEGCQRGIDAQGTHITGWRLTRITCHDNPLEAGVPVPQNMNGGVAHGVNDGMEGGLAVFRWSLNDDSLSLGRQIAERAIEERWSYGAVIERTAWAAHIIPSSTDDGAADPLPFKTFRRTADGILGPISDDLTFKKNGTEWTVRFSTAFPLNIIIRRLGQAGLGQAGLGQAGLGQAGLGQAGLGGLHIDQASKQDDRWTIKGRIVSGPEVSGPENTTDGQPFQGGT